MTTFQGSPESVVTLPVPVVTIPESHLEIAGTLLTVQAYHPPFCGGVYADEEGSNENDP